VPGGSAASRMNRLELLRRYVMHLRTIVISLALIVLLFSTVISQSNVRESFNYPVGEPLEGLGDATGGWGGPWVLFDNDPQENVEVAIVSDENFPYNDEINFPIPNAGNHIIAEQLGEWHTQRYARPLAETWPNEAGNVYWLSAVVEYEGFTNEAWGFVGFYRFVGDTAWVEGPGMGMSWRDELAMGTFVDWAAGFPPPPLEHEGASDVLYADGPQWLVTKIVMSGDTLSRAYLFISPDPEGPEPDTTFADARTNWNLLNGIEYLSFHFGGAAEGQTMKVDEIALGTSWNMVTNVRNDGALPEHFQLTQNYPNPFNPATTISYSLAEAGHVTLTVYNVLGQEVATIVDEFQSQGTYQKTFDATHLSSGVYLYRIQAGSHTDMKKMVLIK
jgi:hypothetical protein